MPYGRPTGRTLDDGMVRIDYPRREQRGMEVL